MGLGFLFAHSYAHTIWHKVIVEEMKETMKEASEVQQGLLGLSSIMNHNTVIVIAILQES